MKTYLHAFFMCQSMFCAIPAPQVWDEKARDKMLLFLPMVGLLGIDWAYGFDKVFGSSQYSGSHFHFILGQEF